MNSSAPRVLVTRSPRQGSALAEHLRALGADPILIPSIEIAEPTSFAILDAALTHLNDFHWLLFTSANAVEAFAIRYHLPRNRALHPSTASPSKPESPAARCWEGKDGVLPPNHHESHTHTLPKQLRLAAIGPATARALQGIGLTPDLVPSQAIAESLSEALLAHSHQPDNSPTRFLLVRAEEAREHLPETLRAAGAEVIVAPAYRTVVPGTSVELIRNLFGTGNWMPHSPTASLSKGGVLSSPAPPLPTAAITFTSASTAHNLLTLCEAAGVVLPASALRISIGPVTSRTLRELGLPAHAEAPEATVRSLAETVMTALAQQ